MPKVLSDHSMLEIQGDLFVFGGYSSASQSEIHKMICLSEVCSWTTINQELKFARHYLVAMSVTDYFCLEGGGCNQGWIADGYCDDINNNLACTYDGGDCCGANVNTQYCSECLCLE
jgi:hypothetical protein